VREKRNSGRRNSAGQEYNTLAAEKDAGSPAGGYERVIKTSILRRLRYLRISCLLGVFQPTARKGHKFI
jgi:hypothetical protein